MRVTVPNRELLSEAVATALDAIVARVNAVFSKEHNGDGTHKTAWTTVPYAASDYSTNGMGWTVTEPMLVTFAYKLQGKSMTVAGIWDGTSTSGAASSALLVRIPGGYVAAKKMQCAAFGVDNGTGIATYNRVQAGATQIEIGRADLANWSAASAANTYPRIHFEFEVQ